METDRACLVHINECIRNIQRYAANGRGQFMSTPVVQDAVLWNLQLICVAAKKVSKGEKQTHPEVDWGHACTMFREMVRDPWALDLEEVWQCVDSELPLLERQLQVILRLQAPRG
jgi:uncharacterized protein with HEPN domain